ncbi:hypothetical protein [Bradyrhizobium sp. ORS 285]|uniref:hypothetical protein n=2 Tax=Bradyrhizobium sp. ORS 285 TaxID=115808 RepID=UPI001FCB6990|nr:hypothetical protein [Bradyrhizobium sp. ORS 285]
MISSVLVQARRPMRGRKAELMAVWLAASQTRLKLPANYLFVPKNEGLRVLRAGGNVVNVSRARGTSRVMTYDVREMLSHVRPTG